MTDLLPYFRGKYPALFSNDALREIGCLAGWLTLLDELCLELQSYLDARPELPPARVLTIKEKFGGLRFYICWGDQHCRTMIALAQEGVFEYLRGLRKRRKHGGRALGQHPLSGACRMVSRPTWR